MLNQVGFLLFIKIIEMKIVEVKQSKNAKKLQQIYLALGRIIFNDTSLTAIVDTMDYMQFNKLYAEIGSLEHTYKNNPKKQELIIKDIKEWIKTL